VIARPVHERIIKDVLAEVLQDAQTAFLFLRLNLLTQPEINAYR